MQWIALLVVMLALPGIVLLLLASGMFAGIGRWHMDRRYKRNRRTSAQMPQSARPSRMTSDDLLERLSGTSVFDDEDKIGAWFEQFFEDNPEAWNYHEQRR